MDNIFENAYFGKPYRTRKGKKARYCGKRASMFELELDGIIIDYFPDGSYYTANESPLDIVSEWQEEINEEELNKFVEEYEGSINWEYNPDYAVYSSEQLINAFKVGYRKALEK